MSMPRLDPELLRAFVAVAERRSFTRAAAHLNRTQATVSLQVRRLEERLGIPLFHRSTTHVELTAAAEGFLMDARRILALGDEAIARLSDHKATGHLRIGVMEDYGTRHLPPLLAAVAERFPLVQVDMEIGLTARMVKRLGSSFDVVIAMHPIGATQGELLCREQAIWVAANDRAIEEFDPLRVALSSPGCLFRAWVVQALNKAGRRWRLAYVSPSLAATEAIVSQGLAITVVKGSMLTPGLRVVRPGERLPPLPGAEIRLHRSATLNRPLTLITDYLANGLRAHSVAIAHTH